MHKSNKSSATYELASAIDSHLPTFILYNIHYLFTEMQSFTNYHYIFYMNSHTILLLSLLSLLSTACFAQECCDLNTIKVSGNAEVKVKPDFATIEIGA